MKWYVQQSTCNVNVRGVKVKRAADKRAKHRNAYSKAVNTSAEGAESFFRQRSCLDEVGFILSQICNAVEPDCHYLKILRHLKKKSLRGAEK
jgi:hypothetical protein